MGFDTITFDDDQDLPPRPQYVPRTAPRHPLLINNPSEASLVERLRSSDQTGLGHLAQGKVRQVLFGSVGRYSDSLYEVLSGRKDYWISHCYIWDGEKRLPGYWIPAAVGRAHLEAAVEASAQALASSKGLTLLVARDKAKGRMSETHRGLSDKHITLKTCAYYENDMLPLGEQLQHNRNLHAELGLPPGPEIYSGNKSVHFYLPHQPVDAQSQLALDIQTALIVATGSDPSIRNPGRLMRQPGITTRGMRRQRVIWCPPAGGVLPTGEELRALLYAHNERVHGLPPTRYDQAIEDLYLAQEVFKAGLVADNPGWVDLGRRIADDRGRVSETTRRAAQAAVGARAADLGRQAQARMSSSRTEYYTEEDVALYRNEQVHVGAYRYVTSLCCGRRKARLLVNKPGYIKAFCFRCWKNLVWKSATFVEQEETPEPLPVDPVRAAIEDRLPVLVAGGMYDRAKEILDERAQAPERAPEIASMVMKKGSPITRTLQPLWGRHIDECHVYHAQYRVQTGTIGCQAPYDQGQPAPQLGATGAAKRAPVRGHERERSAREVSQGPSYSL